MVGIWCVAAWQQMGRPGRLRLVELGPGRGTLMADLLRGTAAFQPFAAALSVGTMTALDGAETADHPAGFSACTPKVYELPGARP